MEQCCGTCKFHRTDDNGEWVCTNDLSEYYALETEYGDTCDDWCGRKLDFGALHKSHTRTDRVVG